MAGVFVSYAREDAAKAKAIARTLEQASFDVWIDGRISSGSEFSREIEQALNSAAAVVVLWSASSIDSGWVRDEAAEGRDTGRLVPVRLDACRPPLGFRQIQATDLSHWSGRGRPRQIDDVIAAVRAKLAAAPQSQQKAFPALARPHRQPVYWIAASAAAVLAITGAYLIQSSRNQAPSSAPSIALLPFTADASDPEARKLASATREALADTLSEGQFQLKLIDSVPRGGRAPADFVISGQLGANPDKATATVRMEDTARRVVLFSDQFEASRKEAWILPERIGAQVAAQVSWAAPLIMIDLRHPTDPALTAQLVQSVTSLNSDLGLLQEYEKARRLARKAPNSGLAQLALAFQTAFALGLIPRGERAEALAAARTASNRAVKLIPEFGDVYIPWCGLRSDQRMVECENRLRAAMRADPDAPFVNAFLSNLLNQVGRNKEASELASLSLAHDRFMPAKIARRLRTLQVTGEVEKAEELYRQSTRWWPGDEQISWSYMSGMMMRGDLEAARQFQHELEGANQRTDDPLPALVSAVKTNSVDRARKACARAQDIDGLLCMLSLARLGDLDAAYRFADRLYPSRRGRTSAEEERIWLYSSGSFSLAFLTSPAAVPLRRDRRYLALAERVGLLEYWRSGRRPDFCTVDHESICKEIARAR